MFLFKKDNATVVAAFSVLMITFSAYIFPVTLMDEEAESWNPNDSPKSYRNLAEERFSMECDYLGIDGKRAKVARELFDTMLAERQAVDSTRSAGGINRIRAIQRLNSIDLAYYLKLKDLVTGKRNRNRIGQLIAKVRGRNESRDKLSAHTR